MGLGQLVKAKILICVGETVSMRKTKFLRFGESVNMSKIAMHNKFLFIYIWLRQGTDGIGKKKFTVGHGWYFMFSILLC